MSSNFLFIAECLIGSFAFTLFAHLNARYLVGPSLFAFNDEMETNNFRTSFFDNYILRYNYLIFFFIFSFFCYFSYYIPTTDHNWNIVPFYMALAVTIITDYYSYLISTSMTLMFLPLAFIYAYKGKLAITLSQSLSAAILIGIMVHIVNHIYYRRKNMYAFGEGDRDLLMLIAAFLGIVGTFEIIFYASLIGCIWALILLILKKQISLGSHILPFGTCLGLGAYFHYFINWYYGPFFLRFLY